MQIGVFGNHDSWYVRDLVRAGTERGHQIFPLLYEDFSSNIQAGQSRFRCGELCLNPLHTILVRTMPPGSLEQVVARMDLLAGLESTGVKILNPPRALECAVDKYLTTQRMAIAGLPVPDTVVCENSEIAMKAFESLGGDVVIKPLFGAEGRGVMRVSDPELAHRAFRTIERLGAVIYLQEFLNGPRFDLRLLLLDGNLIGSMKRIPREGEFRANISQQGTGMPHLPTDGELHLAQQAAEITGTVFAGVDLMYDEENRPVIIEVNAVPGWKGLQAACRVDVAARLFDWIDATRDLR
ncbi:MAG: RimK family alpha-L-glutamate ligase [Planctomyces sp.]|nr:RimK family alpha-L-glutamate ligase [Planctomyces sp.]